MDGLKGIFFAVLVDVSLLPSIRVESIYTTEQAFLPHNLAEWDPIFRLRIM
jgi:hypothetical protein